MGQSPSHILSYREARSLLDESVCSRLESGFVRLCGQQPMSKQTFLNYVISGYFRNIVIPLIMNPTLLAAFIKIPLWASFVTRVSVALACSLALYCSPQPAALCDRIFSAMDVGDRGLIDLEAFVCGIAAVTRGTPEHKLK